MALVCHWAKLTHLLDVKRTRDWLPEWRGRLGRDAESGYVVGLSLGVFALLCPSLSKSGGGDGDLGITKHRSKSWP